MAGSPLAHISHCVPDPKATILLVHGGFSDSHEWNTIWPLLIAERYNVLIPDLPGHGQSREVTPFELDDAARLLAHLIQDHTLEQRAHVVAMSIGAHVAATLAVQYPERVHSLIISGFNLFSPNLLSPALPYLAYTVQRTSSFLKAPTVEWGQSRSEGVSLATTCDIFRILFSSRTLGPIVARSCVVAATKPGLSADNVHHARRLFETIHSDSGRRLVQHRGMQHPWNVDEPQLFAKMVICWVQGEDLPEGFEPIA
ncbi:hypothetical protein POX_g09374 [Penicillium oxalicum]|uniref:hypothetical protein n=1 Tax=Penicillium oxalicum TaxID=69781 RepID=UPI0020B7CE8A|nr:hypothetical protein POX_g09374 [Penicillium oxalicum]KAI2786977.1 hypothetical protein POX_g09374 [Penicillium oxalicum]